MYKYYKIGNNYMSILLEQSLRHCNMYERKKLQIKPKRKKNFTLMCMYN